MATLSSSIVKNRVASMRDVEEALARQVLYGGDLATNLLELAAVSEGELTQLLAESHGLAAAAVGELPQAGDAVLRLVPGELAHRHAFYPIEERDGVLVIAVSEPLPPEVEEDLCFALGVRLEQRAAPVVRIRQAIARDYGLPLDRRTLRLVAKLEGRADPSPSSMPPPMHGAAETALLPRPASVPPMVYPPETGLAPPGSRATPPPAPEPETQPKPAPAPSPPPPSAAEAQAATTRRERTRPPQAPPPKESGASGPASRAVRTIAVPERGRRRHRGPYTAAMAEKDLMEAGSRDDVLRAFFDFSSQYFEYSALFAVHGDIAEGKDAHGPGASAERIARIGVPLDLPGALSLAKKEGSWRLHRLQDDGLDKSVAKDLERPAGKQVLLLPVIVRGRCVLILYGDHGEADVSLSDVGDVISFAALVAAALERVILKRKLAARRAIAEEDGAPPPRPGRERPKSRLPSAEDRVRALAGAIDLAGPATALPRTRAESPHGKAAAPISTAPSTGLESPTAKQSLAPATPAESPSAKKTSLPPRREPPKPPVRQPRGDAVRTVISGVTPEAPPKKVSTPPQGTPKRLDPEVTGEPQPFPLTRRTPRPPVQHAEEATEDGWAPPLEPEASFGSVSKPPSRRARTAPGLGVAPSSRPAPSSKRDGNRRLELVEQAVDAEPKREETSIEVTETAELDDDLVDALAREEEAPLAPSSRSVAYGPRRLRPRQSAKELALPSVIIDLESECSELLERLFAGDAEAGETLVQIGEPAVSVLVSRFPGPITVDPRRLSAEGARASESGPLLRVIARIGPAAIPFLVVRTADADPEVRAWSTRLLGEMPSMEAARAIARRFLDGDESVRRAALAAGRMMQSDDESRAALRDGLAQLAADPAQSEDARLGAIEALADVRDPRAVPRLIPLLGDRNAEIAKLVHWALSVLARNELGRDPKAWHEWWRENGVRHRIEWLIDALMNDSAEIRRAAGDELKVLTKEYFGYYDDLPKRERAKAQKKYREWWDTKGKARFR